MTPFTADQLAAVLAAAEPLQEAYRRLDTAIDLEHQGQPVEAEQQRGYGFGMRRGYVALVRLAWAGLPTDLALEVGQQQIDGEGHPLLGQVLDGRLPPGAILDLLREFLARPGQAADESVAVAGAGITVGHQVSLDQAGLHEQSDVFGKNLVGHVVPPVVELAVVTAPGGQEHAPD